MAETQNAKQLWL